MGWSAELEGKGDRLEWELDLGGIWVGQRDSSCVVQRVCGLCGSFVRLLVQENHV